MYKRSSKLWYRYYHWILIINIRFLWEMDLLKVYLFLFYSYFQTKDIDFIVKICILITHQKQKDIMEQIILTKSSINRVLRIIKRLKGKDLEEQVEYLTIHLIKANDDEDDLKIWNQVRKKKLPFGKLEETIAYKNANWFWSQDKNQLLLDWKEGFYSFRRQIVIMCRDERTDDMETSANLPNEIVVILRWLKLCH